MTTEPQLPRESTSPEVCHIESLPTDILIQIFEEIDYYEHQDRQQTLFTCSLVCCKWNAIALPLLWKSIEIQIPPRYRPNFHNFLAMQNPPWATAAFVQHLSITLDDVYRASRFDSYDPTAEIVLACRELRNVDITLVLEDKASVALQITWVTLATYLASLDLNTLQVKFDISTSRYFPNEGGAAQELLRTLYLKKGFIFSVQLNIISTQLTHLTIAQTNVDFNYFHFIDLPRFKRLRSFTFFLKLKNARNTTLRAFTDTENTIFWTSLQTAGLQQLALHGLCLPFSWNNDIDIILPSTLTKLEITLPPFHSPKVFDLTFLLKRFPRVLEFRVRTENNCNL
jgi:hypothetical protein